jgi:hypothetical protein
MPRRRARRCTAANRAYPTDATRNRDEQVAIFIENHLPNRSLEENLAPSDERPAVAAIGRFVDADAGF